VGSILRTPQYNYFGFESDIVTNCNCCGTAKQSDDSELREQATDGGSETTGDGHDWPRTTGSSADGEPVTDRALSDDVGRALGDLFGTSPPATFGDWIDDVHEALDEEEWMPPRVQDLCYDADGKHLARTPNQSYRFACVLDAFALHALVDEPVTVESSVPDGGEVALRVSDEGVSAVPTTTVLSFGAAVDPDLPDGRSPAVAYGQTCPYIHAFPSQAAYEVWDESTPDGVTTVVSPREVRDLAAALVEGTEET
jgi:hypothetical protein